MHNAVYIPAIQNFDPANVWLEPGQAGRLTRWPLLEVEDLHVSFATADGVVQAVRGLSFEVDRGRTLGIVGESGSGKSVSTQTITGLTRGRRGHAARPSFDGVDLLDGDRRRELRDDPRRRRSG